ncbi:hypothetical protein QAD02_000480 [Eretmocerus hayati]|uniref:Uncharacterized protein n=1 Tax=Eretmocerus hayati TaxID=131215 RepID=A0ACC2NF14_9HYME|nr:hypothetical protein QAD02_000480 [Eretmocerus hayati]
MENDADSTAARRNTFFRPWKSSPSVPTPVSAARVDHDLRALAPTPVLINETLQEQVLTFADTAAASFHPQALGSSTVSASKNSFRAQGPVFTSVPAVNANFCPQAPLVTVFSMGRVDIGRQNQKSETGRRQTSKVSQLLHSTARDEASSATTMPNAAAQVPGLATVSASSEYFCSQAPVSTTVPAVGANFYQLTPTVSIGRADIGRQNPTLEIGPRQSLDLSQLPHSAARAEASTAITRLNSPAQALASTLISVDSESSRAQALLSTAEPAINATFCLPTATANVGSCGRVNAGLQIPTLGTGTRQSLNFSQLSHFTAMTPQDCRLRSNKKSGQNKEHPLRSPNGTPLLQEKDQKAESTEKLDFILKYVNSLEQEVKSIKAQSRSELEYVFRKEALNEVLCELGNINVKGMDSVRKRKKRLTVKVNKIIDLLDLKVPLVDERTQPSDQGQREKSDAVLEKDQEELRSEIAQQQVEKIREILQIKFGNTGDQAAELRSEVNDPSNAVSSVNMESVSESHPPGLIKKSCREWHEDFLYKFDKRTGNGTRHADVAIQYSLEKVERQMQRWRSKVRTRGTGKVRTIDDYVKFFETPEGQQLLEYDPPNQRKLSYKVITESVKTKKGEKIFKHLALYDEKTLEEHEKCEVLQDDATFLSRPKVHGVTQLFTIMARNYDKALLRNAIKKGCATHRNLKDNPERHLIIRMPMALASLPSDVIKKTYEEIKELAQLKHGKYFDPLFQYLEDYWFKRRGVKRFCVFKKLDKTNNEQESMHKILNFLFKHRQPYPWQFIDVFIEILQIDNFNLRVERETMGTTKRRRKKQVIFNEADLLRCWYLLEHKPKSFTPMMMVTKVAYSLKPKYIQLGQIHSVTLFNGDDDEENEEQSSGGVKVAGDEENVIGTVTNLRIDIEDIEKLFDADLEEKTAPKSMKRRIENLIEGSRSVEDLPPKRSRKSVMDGKYRDYSS